MENTIQQIINNLTTSPGNLIYHLILSFSIMAALQALLAVKKVNLRVNYNRLLIGLIILLLAQVFLFFVSALSWRGFMNPHLVIPPLDRAITVFSLVWIIWLWCFPNSSKIADISVAALSLVVGAFYLLTVSIWNFQTLSYPFNGIILDVYWQGFSILLALSGMFILIFKHAPGWWYGFTMILFSLVGAIFHVVAGSIDSDYAGAVRLFQICSYPLLPTLTQLKYKRISADKCLSIPADSIRDVTQPGIDSRAINSWLTLIQKIKKEPAAEDITRAVGITMQSDLCYLISSPRNDEKFTIHCGYDLLKDKNLTGHSLTKEHLPFLHGALQSEKPFHLKLTGQDFSDLQTLAALTGCEKPDNLLMVPWRSQNQVQWGILLVSPISNKAWNDDDLSFLMRITDAVEALPFFTRTVQISEARKESPVNLFKSALSSQQQTEDNTASQVEGLIAVQNDLQTIIENLQSENDQLRSTLESFSLKEGSNSNKNLENELRMAHKEVTYLQEALATANSKILNLEGKIPPSGKPANNETLSSITLDIRRSMSSLIGYCDLLLTESVGMIGDMQRKFLERIRSYVEQVTLLQSKLEGIYSTAAQDSPDRLGADEINSIINIALSDPAIPIKEKNLSIRVGVQDFLAVIITNRNALLEIVINLLKNSSSVSHENGVIDLQINQVVDDTGQSNILIRVTDFGDGFDFNNLQGILSLPSIPSGQPLQGDETVAERLSAIKCMIDKLGGKIWAENDPGKSTTINALLPAIPAIDRI